ncbi:MAG: copper amine oxidase N-terminal domain-containing protein [Clostridia bacterium]|nr:copper amine oxidase N-terminal domain-containing protein [Clostridia bacterium]
MKKILSLVLAALLLVCACSLTAFAADGTVAYISFTASNDNDGLTASTAKKSFGTFDATGVMSLLANGGTMVVVGKAYIGGSYTLPAMSAPLTITSVYDGVDYKKAEPAENPDCAFKMASGANFTISSDVTFDDIILFQENDQNTITVPLGTTLTITDKAVLQTKPGNDYHYKIVVEMGGTAILSKAAQEVCTIENLGGTVSTYGGDAPVAPASGVELKMTVGKTDYTLNGETKTMDVAPIIINSRTMLPVRYVAEALGAEIGWDGATSTATLKTADTEIKITVGADSAIVNGQAVKLDSPAVIVSDRSFMPVRFVAETLGGTVAWDGATSTATITK